MMKAIKVCVLLLVVVSVFMVFGCGGAEKNAGATQPKKVFTPDWYGVNDNPDYIYVYGSAEKLNANISEEAAKGFAYSEAAQYVEASVKTMLKNFISESGVENPEVVALTENVTKVVASTKFSGTQVSKRESYTMREWQDKDFYTFVDTEGRCKQELVRQDKE